MTARIKWNKYWKMWNYINMLANHVCLLQSSWWRHSLSGGNSDCLTAECVCSLKLSRISVGGVSGPFHWKPPPCCGLEWHRVQEPKKTWFCWQHTHTTQFLDSSDHFSAVSSLSVLHFPVVSRCQLRYTSLLQVRTMQDYCLCVSVLMCTHFCSQI